MLNGLSRTVLKATLPGVPDIYQGTELWDLSLVDPDNRRPVDYRERIQALDAEEPLSPLFGTWRDGRIKQQMLARLLADRAASPALYASGDYHALAASGALARHLLGFSRTLGSERLAVVMPRLVAALARDETMPLGAAWRDSSVAIPPGRWRNVLTGDALETDGDGTAAADLLSVLPFCVLRAQP